MKIQFIHRKTKEIITEIPPSEGLLKFLYDNPFGKTAVLPIAKRKFISEYYGKKMHKPSSTKKIEGFVKQLDIDFYVITCNSAYSYLDRHKPFTFRTYLHCAFIIGLPNLLYILYINNRGRHCCMLAAAAALL